MQFNPKLVRGLHPFGSGKGGEPAPGRSHLSCSPLADGTHDVMRSLSLVEPCVVAVPHQLIGFCLLAPHVLVEVSKVHGGKLLQTQHSCTGRPHQCLPGPCGASTAAGSTSLPTPKVAAAPGLRHWGGHVHLSPPGLGSDEPGFCHIGP